MIRFLVTKPIAVLISFFAFLVLGITAFLFIPASLLPDIDVPQIVVRLKGANYSTREVEQSLTAPIRNSLLQITGLERIESSSSEGGATIRLIFEPGSNTGMGFIGVNEKVDAAMNQLPKDAERPLVTKVGVGDIPVFNLNIYPNENNVSTERLAEISNFAREVIRKRIEQLPEVAMVDISGYTQPQLQLTPKQGYLQSIGLDQNELIKAFDENKVNLGNIMVKDGHYQYYLNFPSELQNITAIENTPINIAGRLFKLNELATVRYANAPESGAFFSNGHRAINFAIIKQSGTKMADLKKSFDQLLWHLKKDYPDIVFEIAQDQTSLLNYAVSNLEQDLLLGGILAFVLMLVFIRKIRSALLIGITIPVALVISQLGFYLLGISLNVISLGGLILGLAMIIDNSIVVIDNISRHRNEGLTIEEACVQGTNEVVRPLITSVLTNCAVFIPLIFMSGLAGAIFYDQALSITIGVISSLLVAIILLPPLYKLIYTRKKRSSKREFEFKSYVNLTGWYEWGLKKVFNYPLLTCTVVICLLGVAFTLFGILKKDRLPPITRYDMEVGIDWNENISIDENQKRIDFLVQKVRSDITESNAWLGEQQYLLSQSKELSYTQAKLYLKVSNANKLVIMQKRIENLCAQAYPQALLSFSPARNAFDEIFAEEMAPLRLDVSATENRTMPKITTTKLFIDKLKKDLPYININPIPLYDKIVLKVNQTQATLYHISTAKIGKQIASTFKPVLVDNFQDAQILVPIVLVNETYASVNDMLSQTFIRNTEGVDIPLSSLISVSYENEYKYITAGIQGEYYPIDIYTKTPEKDLPIIKKIMAKDFKNLEVNYRGSYFDNNKLIGEMAIILVVSVLLLYFILAAQFESLVQPLFMLVELPIALSGAFIFLYLGGNSINLMSMIGIIVMGGLIINDSILKIDAINQLRRQGVSLIEAIYGGGHKRLKPIVMISLTSIGSLLPTLFMNDLGSELQKPLALSLIGGMFIGLFVSLFFVPLLYWFVYRKKGDRIAFIKHKNK